MSRHERRPGGEAANADNGWQAKNRIAVACRIQVSGGPTFELAAETVAKLSRPGTEAGRLQRAVLAILLEHRDAGSLPTSARFVYYELEQRGVIDKKKPGGGRTDQPVTVASSALRKAGVVPWDWIVDETRTVTEWESAATVADYLRNAVEYARIDVWDGEPAPLVLTESRSLAGVLRVMLGDYLTPLSATNGQVGGFLHTDVVPLLVDNKRPVLYLGDLDHQGGQIEANTRRVVEEAAGRAVEWERLALTGEQVEQHNIPSTYKKDSRYKPPRWHTAYETEALQQSVIVALVRDRLDQLLPEPLAVVQVREARQRQVCAAALAGLDLAGGGE